MNHFLRLLIPTSYGLAIPWNDTDETKLDSYGFGFCCRNASLFFLSLHRQKTQNDKLALAIAKASRDHHSVPGP